MMVPLLFGAALIRPAAANIVTFNFEDAVFGADTPLSLTEEGLTATFASPAADPGGFGITSAFALWPEMSGNILASPGTAFVDGVPLIITFSKPVRAVDLQFGLGGIDPSGEIDLSTNAGGSASAHGTIPGGAGVLPQGEITFAGDYFTTLTLTSTALDFGIDNLQVDLPEPASAAILGLGLFVLGWVRRRTA
jgi:hypothetical protein